MKINKLNYFVILLSVLLYSSCNTDDSEIERSISFSGEWKYIRTLDVENGVVDYIWIPNESCSFSDSFKFENDGTYIDTDYREDSLTTDCFIDSTFWGNFNHLGGDFYEFTETSFTASPSYTSLTSLDTYQVEVILKNNDTLQMRHKISASYSRYAEYIR